MITGDLEKLKYPIGKFVPPSHYSKDILQNFITVITEFPGKLRKETIRLNNEQLDTPYRPDGWTLRQVVHHCADSHMNGFTRFKLTLTEDKPTIKPYMENLFAELADSKTLPVESSLLSLEGIHTRWGVLLQSMKEHDFKRVYIHPEYQKEFSLHEATGLYAWHCNHHLAHITTLKQTQGW